MSITTSILLAAASMLPALIASVGRFFREKDLLSFSLVFLCGMLEATFISAFFHADYMMSLLVTYGLPIHNHLSYICVASLSGCIILSLMMFANVRFIEKQYVWKWILGAFVLLLLVIIIIGIAVSMATGLSFDQGFFAACCGVMGASGVAWGLTYKEICVIGNIYMEAGICLLSALWFSWSTIKVFRQRRSVSSGLLMSAGILYGLINLIGFWMICSHYAMPLEKAFDLCYHELIVLASDWHTTYNNVNYLIFILLFLVLTLGNILVANCLLRISYKKTGN